MGNLFFHAPTNSATRRQMRTGIPLQPPPPQFARKSQQIGGTTRRTDFLTKQLPTDLDRSSRPQTHLPFGCCAIRVMWELKVPLNFRKINSHLGLYMVLEQLHHACTVHCYTCYIVAQKAAPLSYHGLVQTETTFGLLGNNRFCSSDPMENVVCRFCAGCRKAPYECQSVGVAVISCALVPMRACWSHFLQT